MHASELPKLVHEIVLDALLRHRGDDELRGASTARTKASCSSVVTGRPGLPCRSCQTSAPEASMNTARFTRQCRSSSVAT